jgi:hypothetical protein
MTKKIEALFDGEVLRPEGEIDLKPNVRYMLIVKQVVQQKEGRNVWEVLQELNGVIKGPRDWSVEHDHYLYGTPKRRGGVNS